MRQRIEWIDTIKGIVILLMMVGHYEFTPPTLKKMIYSFHMPIFFILSGYLSYSSNNNFNVVFAKKTKSLLIPYIFWCFIMIIANMILHQPADYTFVKGLEECFLLNKPASRPLWFLFTLYLTDLLFFLLKNCNILLMVFYLFILILVGETLSNKHIYLFFRTEIVCFSLAYYMIGVVLKRTNILLHLRKLKRKVTISVVSFLFITGMYWAIQNNAYDMYINRDISYSQVLLAIFISLTIIVILSQTDNLLCKKLKKGLRSIALNAIIILALHSKIYFAIDKIFFSFPQLQGLIFLHLTVTIIIELFMLMLLSKMCNRFIPWTVGKS